MQIELQSMAIALPPLENHPNRMPFRGVLTWAGVPSNKPPSGAKGHRVLLTRSAVERALPSLLGMGLDYASSLDRHDARRKIGIITEANLRDSCQAANSGSSSRKGTASRHGYNGKASSAALEVSGYLYAKDFPEVVREVRADRRKHLGMSYEIADARVAEISAEVWEITSLTFTGAAMLRRDKAAYAETWIELQ